MSPSGLPVLTYHAIDTSGSVIATDPSWFAETLSALDEAGFQSVDLHDWIAQGRPAVARRFALTFDDGLRSVLPAAEILSRHRFQATAFLVTDRMGRDNAWPGQPRGITISRVLDWSDLDALSALGFRFGAHTRTHPYLTRCDDAALESELRGSRVAIEDRTGRPCRLLAYPYGTSNRRVRMAAGRTFDAAFGTNMNLANDRESVHHLSRIDAYDLRSERALTALIEGHLVRRLRPRAVARKVRWTAKSWMGG